MMGRSEFFKYDDGDVVIRLESWGVVTNGCDK